MGWEKNTTKQQQKSGFTNRNKSQQKCRKELREIERQMDRCTKYNLWEDTNIPLHIGPLFCVFISDKQVFNNLFSS